MSLFETAAILVTLSAFFSYINFRYIKLPTTIGIMLLALTASTLVILLGFVGSDLDETALILLESIDFNEAVLHGMLAFLLFAGSLHVNLNDLSKQQGVIGALASFGVLSSTFLVGTLTWLVLGVLETPLSYLECLLFGALISPTDPIAVMGILKGAGVPKSLETQITGESLFNDGVGVVVFLALLELSRNPGDSIVGSAGSLFLLEAGGGLLLGLATGYLAFRMLRSVDNYQVEVLITLALVTGSFALADRWHLSGPIAIVVAGLLIGNHGRMLAMSERTIRHLDTFWELVDEILNAVLFLLIGLEILVLRISSIHLLIILVTIPIVLASRFLSVSLPITVFQRFRDFTPGVIRILTWAGLRGGISVALARSLPPGEAREIFLPATYGVVVFSIAVQGLTINRLVRKVSS
ncbi:MAG: sodium:proton antiporter [Acidobacteriota bacterium]|nr:MAG: sodium:proton antiporter [Acidobacteriota bacterium]